MSDSTLIMGRSLRSALRRPAVIVINMAVGLLFLLVYHAGSPLLAGPSAPGGSHLAFVLPVAIVSAAVSGAGYAGQTLVRDMETGYLTRLLLTPTRRMALVWGPILTGALLVVAQVVLMLVVAVLMGLDSATGIWGLVVVAGFAFLWGLAFAGYAVIVALLTRSAAAAAAATFACFPLIFLSSAFGPRGLISGGWFKAAVSINPTTYVVEPMRAVLLNGWEARSLLMGLTVLVGLAALTGGLALWQLGRATRPADR